MFIARNSRAISIGNTATKVRLNNLITPKGGNPDASYRKASKARLINTHATQLLYYRRDPVTTITTTNADGVVGAGKEVIFSLQDDDEIQLLGSGATTTGYLETGNTA